MQQVPQRPRPGPDVAVHAQNGLLESISKPLDSTNALSMDAFAGSPDAERRAASAIRDLLPALETAHTASTYECAYKLAEAALLKRLHGLSVSFLDIVGAVNEPFHESLFRFIHWRDVVQNIESCSQGRDGADDPLVKSVFGSSGWRDTDASVASQKPEVSPLPSVSPIGHNAVALVASRPLCLGTAQMGSSLEVSNGPSKAPRLSCFQHLRPSLSPLPVSALAALGQNPELILREAARGVIVSAAVKVSLQAADSWCASELLQMQPGEAVCDELNTALRIVPVSAFLLPTVEERDALIGHLSEVLKKRRV